MSDDGDEECAHQISAVFALLTAKFEDAAASAADGQARRSDPKLRSIANQVGDLAAEAALIAKLLAALLDQRLKSPSDLLTCPAVRPESLRAHRQASRPR